MTSSGTIGVYYLKLCCFSEAMPQLSLLWMEFSSPLLSFLANPKLVQEIFSCALSFPFALPSNGFHHSTRGTTFAWIIFQAYNFFLDSQLD